MREADERTGRIAAEEEPHESSVMIDAWEIPDPYDACAKGKRAIEQALAKG